MSRADRVVGRLGERGADLLLVTDLVNIGYLTGFTGSSAMVVLGPETRRFITDFRYVERAKAEVSDFDRERAPQEFAEALKTGWPEGTVRLGFEDQHLSVRQHKRLRELLPERIELVPAGGAVEAERALKEPGEVEKIRAAAALADEIYDWVRERGLVGRTEREVALGLATRFFQSNFEGEYVEELHRASDYADALILNPGAWTHYAWALRDALEIAGLPAVEVHLSDIAAREAWRHLSVLEGVVVGRVKGQGVDGYRSALEMLKEAL